ncbi:MAG TPA: hypothetical protein VFP97_12460, partial [Chitinophagaceae bacterium]|nr:hypothetical protein [Chitinophagaceae bacterium]
MKERLNLLFILLILAQSNLLAQPDTSFKIYEQNVPGSSIKFKMMPVKGGSFTMGSPENEPGRDAD